MRWRRSCAVKSCLGRTATGDRSKITWKRAWLGGRWDLIRQHLPERVIILNVWHGQPGLTGRIGLGFALPYQGSPTVATAARPSSYQKCHAKSTAGPTSHTV
jgi:hypothetical protein